MENGFGQDFFWGEVATSRIGISITMVFFLLSVFTACGRGGVSGSSHDNDGGGYADASCGGADCNDADPRINPLVRDICGDNIDQNCYDGDVVCSADAATAHANLTRDGSPGICLSCHTDEAEDMYASTHYQWQGDALYMSHGPQKQGKSAGGVNSYCINILGSWDGCGKCHVGLGARPKSAGNPTQAQLEKN